MTIKMDSSGYLNEKSEKRKQVRVCPRCVLSKGITSPFNEGNDKRDDKI